MLIDQKLDPLLCPICRSLSVCSHMKYRCGPSPWGFTTTTCECCWRFGHNGLSIQVLIIYGKIFTCEPVSTLNLIEWLLTSKMVWHSSKVTCALFLFFMEPTNSGFTFEVSLCHSAASILCLVLLQYLAKWSFYIVCHKQALLFRMH